MGDTKYAVAERELVSSQVFKDCVRVCFTVYISCNVRDSRIITGHRSVSGHVVAVKAW